MSDATQRWEGWPARGGTVATVCTRPGWGRLGPWGTGMVRGGDEPTMTPLLTALGLAARWRVLEPLAADGAWDRAAVERQPRRLLAQAHPARGGRAHPGAGDDPTWPRTRAQGWSPCTLDASRARSPTRAETVSAQNGVVMGEVLPGLPWRSLPQAARRYGRKHPLPAGETVQTKTAWAVGLWRQAEAASSAPSVGGLDGASAVTPGVAPRLHPGPGRRRRESLTRRRGAARRSHPGGSRARQQGRRPTWGARRAAPQPHGSWSTSWPAGRAWGYGRPRTGRSQHRRCRWSVSGPEIPVPVFVIAVPGSRQPWFLVTTALERSAAPVVEVVAARVRQAGGCRDHHQRLGLAACRAWTQAPVRRTGQGHMGALPLRRRRPCRLDQTRGSGHWWSTPAW
jgi:hypothetical protein